MPSNVEIKAKVDDLDALKRVAEGLADRPVEHLRQSDTFFNSPNVRFCCEFLVTYIQCNLCAYHVHVTPCVTVVRVV